MPLSKEVACAASTLKDVANFRFRFDETLFL
jgi:hypothetical protein